MFGRTVAWVLQPFAASSQKDLQKTLFSSDCSDSCSDSEQSKTVSVASGVVFEAMLTYLHLHPLHNLIDRSFGPTPVLGMLPNPRMRVRGSSCYHISILIATEIL